MTRKRLYKLLLSTGMQRNDAQKIMCSREATLLTHRAQLRLAVHTCLPAMWLHYVYNSFGAMPARYRGQLCALRWDGGKFGFTVTTVMAPELMAELPQPQHVLPVRTGHIRRVRSLNQAAILTLAKLEDISGGDNNA